MSERVWEFWLDLGGKGQAHVRPGAAIRLEMPGGGGWGRPERK